ncbi:MAG: metallophosphoesterase, partial [bacterium]
YIDSMKNIRYIPFILGMIFMLIVTGAEYPDTDFMVFSDPHLYSIELGTGTELFEEYLNSDRKMLALSEEILSKATQIVIDSAPNFLIIPGDMTKDGELLNHQLMTKYLSEIEDNDIAVYVIPGNHDINNPHAFAYTDTSKTRVPTISPDEFNDIYNEFGYGEALYRDAASLSYIAQPVEGLWILGIDACYYEDNFKDNYPATEGRIRPRTMQWIEERLKEARKRDIAVIAMMHHGLTEHFTDQKAHYPPYVVDNHKEVSSSFAEWGIDLCFTGHFHANDITRADTDNGPIYDIETGSLVTYPAPLRTVQFKNSNAHIKSIFIERIPSHKNFSPYAREYAAAGIKSIAYTQMKKYWVKDSDITIISDKVADVFMHHYDGSEHEIEDMQLITDSLSIYGKIIAYFQKGMVEVLKKDLPPEDNEVLLELGK